MIYAFTNIRSIKNPIIFQLAKSYLCILLKNFRFILSIFLSKHEWKSKTEFSIILCKHKAKKVMTDEDQVRHVDCRVIIDVNLTNKALLAFCSFGVTYIINTNEGRMLEIRSKMNENSFNCFNRVNWVIWERPEFSPGRHACWSLQRDLSILSNQVTLNRILLGYLKSISD